jgi:hypothetical protein
MALEHSKPHFVRLPRRRTLRASVARALKLGDIGADDEEHDEDDPDRIYEQRIENEHE